MLVDDNVVRKVSVVADKTQVKQQAKRAVIEGLYKIKPLFCKPHILRLIHACINTFCMMMGYSIAQDNKYKVIIRFISA